jgi:hypothetical protein
MFLYLPKAHRLGFFFFLIKYRKLPCSRISVGDKNQKWAKFTRQTSPIRILRVSHAVYLFSFHIQHIAPFSLISTIPHVVCRKKDWKRRDTRDAEREREKKCARLKLAWVWMRMALLWNAINFYYVTKSINRSFVSSHSLTHIACPTI